jgi:hypothetical protein
LEATSTDPSTTSSPPPLAGGHVLDQADAFYGYPPMPLSSSQDISAFNTATFTGAPMPAFSPGLWAAAAEARIRENTPLNCYIDPTGAHDFNTVPTLDRSVSWDDASASMFDPQLMPNAPGKAQMNVPSPVLWGRGGAAITPIQSSSPIPGTPGAPGGHPHAITSNAPYGVAQDGSMWPMQPTRSMTLASPSELTSHYQNQLHSQVAPDFKRRMTTPVEAYRQSVNNPGHNPNPSIPELQQAQIPVSYGAQPSPALDYSMWNTYPGPQLSPAMVGTGPEDFGGWYSEPLPFSQGKEEEFGLPNQGQTLSPPRTMQNPG